MRIDKYSLAEWLQGDVVAILEDLYYKNHLYF